MKTLKLTLLATLVAFTMVSLANADGFKEKPKKLIQITISKAMQDPGLVADMYKQLDPSFLNDYEYLYVVTVEHEGAIYKILGSRLSWIRFFRMKEKSNSWNAKIKAGDLN